MSLWAQRILKMVLCRPPPTGNGPGRNRRRHNWPVPITHRGGSAEATWTLRFNIKLPRADRILASAYPQRSMKIRQVLWDFLINFWYELQSQLSGNGKSNFNGIQELIRPGQSNSWQWRYPYKFCKNNMGTDLSIIYYLYASVSIRFWACQNSRYFCKNRYSCPR